ELLNRFRELNIEDVDSIRNLQSEVEEERQKSSFLYNEELDAEIDEYLGKKPLPPNGNENESQVIDGTDVPDVPSPDVPSDVVSEVNNEVVTENNTDNSVVPEESEPVIVPEDRVLADGSILKPDGTRIFEDGTA